MNFFVCVGLFFIFKMLITRLIDKLLKRRSILWPDYESSAVQSTCFKNDLGEKIFQMRSNPFTNEADWRALLPVCQYVDEWYAETHPELHNPSRWGLEMTIKSILKGDEMMA